MQIHAKKVEERCRVCGSFLVEDKAKKKRKTYNCIQFAKDLHSKFLINTSLDMHPPTHHPLCDTTNMGPTVFLLSGRPTQKLTAW